MTGTASGMLAWQLFFKGDPAATHMQHASQHNQRLRPSEAQLVAQEEYGHLAGAPLHWDH